MNFYNYCKLISEAPIDTGEYPDFISKERRRGWEQGGPDVNEILRILPDNAQEYFEMIISKTYQRILSKLAHYKGVEGSQITGSMVMECMQAVDAAIRIEAGKHEQLQRLAKETVINLPDFNQLDAIKRGKLQVFGKIMVGNLNTELDRLINQLESTGKLDDNDMKGEEGGENPMEDAIDNLENADVPADGDLSEEEELDKQLAEFFGVKEEEENNEELVNPEDLEGDMFDELEQRLIRRLANVFTQGTAIDGMYVFELVRNELQQITGNQNIGQLYGLCSIAAHISYFMTAPGGEEGASKEGSAGVVRLIEYPKNSGKYVVIALGILFPYLVHELIKGIAEYMHLSKHTKNVEKVHNVSHESTDLAMSELPRFIRLLMSERPKNLAKDIPIESLVGVIRKHILEMPVKRERDEILRGLAPIKNAAKMTPQEKATWERNHKIAKDKVYAMLDEIINDYGLDEREDEDEDEY